MQQIFTGVTGPYTQHDVGIKATWLGLKTQVKYFSLFFRVATTNKTGQKSELTREKLDVDGVKCQLNHKVRCDNMQNDLRHWYIIHIPFGETRLLYYNACEDMIPIHK